LVAVFLIPAEVDQGVYSNLVQSVPPNALVLCVVPKVRMLRKS
jgi:hypothetical protein